MSAPAVAALGGALAASLALAPAATAGPPHFHMRLTDAGGAALGALEQPLGPGAPAAVDGYAPRYTAVLDDYAELHRVTVSAETAMGVLIFAFDWAPGARDETLSVGAVTLLRHGDFGLWKSREGAAELTLAYLDARDVAFALEAEIHGPETGEPQPLTLTVDALMPLEAAQ